MPTDSGPIRLGRAMLDGRPSIVIGHQGGVAALRELVPEAPETISGLIESWTRWRPALLAALPTAANLGRESELVWLPPLIPPKLICVGANYSEHNAEMLGEVSSPFPYTFLKPPTTTVIATGQPVPAPAHATKLDYEAELAAVMGPGGSVFGYTVLNDLSVRDWVPGIPILGIDWVVSKGFDRSAPLGPWIIPAESVPDPQDLMIRLWVNDELRQQGSTADMVFSIAQCVDHLNRVMTLEPGDVIGTGTPAGVGMGDGRYLTAGDTVRIEIEGIGVQQTHIIAAGAPAPNPAPTTQENNMTDTWLRDYYDDVDHMRLEEFLAWHTDNVRVQFGNNPTANGKDEVRSAIGHFWEIIGGLKHNFVTVVQDGPTTVLEANIDYQRQDGRTVTVPCATLLHREGEKIDQVKIFADLAPVFAPAG